MGDLRPTIMGLGISMPLLAIVSVVLRFQARIIKHAKFQADDYMVLIGLVLAIALAVDVMIDCEFGNLGGHETFEDGFPVIGSWYFIFQKTDYAAQLLWYPCVGTTKISILLFYKRIFVGRRFRLLVYGMIAFICAWMLSFEMSHLLGCIPISGLWAVTPGNYKCVNTQSLYTAGSVTDIATDVAILALPVYNVWKLQMPTSRKLAVIGTFLLGTLVIVTGIVRLAYVVEAFGALAADRTADGTYIYAPAIFWTMIETSLGVVSACLPTLRPLYGAYSVRSMVQSLRTVVSRRGLLRHGGSSSSRRLHSSGEASNTELNSGFTKFGQNGPGMPDNTYEFSAEGMPMNNIESPKGGIMVKKDVSLGHQAV